MGITTLVYTGWAGNGVFGFVPDVNHTFQISSVKTEAAGIGNNWFAQAGNGFVFSGENGTGQALYFSDGTNTVLYSDPTVNRPNDFAEFGAYALFQNGAADNLLTFDGQGNFSTLFSDNVDSYFAFGGSLYVLTSLGLHRLDQNLNISRVFDVENEQLGFEFVDHMFELNGEIWVRASKNVSENDYVKYNPATGTVTEMNIAENNGGDSLRWEPGGVGDTKFYTYFQGTGTGLELHVSDGTIGGHTLVEDIRPGSGTSLNDPNFTTTLGDLFFFSADDGGPDGEELWVSDGTAAGTFALTGSSNPNNLSLASTAFSIGSRIITAGNQVFFTAASDQTGRDLFVSDGTLAGTRLVQDFDLRSSGLSFLGTAGDSVLFTSSRLDGSAVWVSDGTAAGTQILTNSTPGNNDSNSTVQFANFIELDADNIPTRNVMGDGTSEALDGSDLNEMFAAAGGNDTIDAGGGNDTVTGGDGEDLIRGRQGNDFLDGGERRDIILGDNGNDTLMGGAGNDALRGGNGNDLIEGETGRDRLFGGLSGNDTLIGGAGNDLLRAGNQNDVLDGGDGDDAMFGGAGFDLFIGGLGNDIMTGAFNADRFVFADGHGQDTVTDFDANNNAEKLDFSGLSTLNTVDDVLGPDGAASQVGADVLIDTGGGNTILLQNVVLGDLDSLDFVF